MHSIHTPTDTASTPEVAELLVNLMGECGETTQAASKVLQHGPGSYNPILEFPGPSNINSLERELGDILGVIKKLAQLGYIDEARIAVHADAKLARLPFWTHGELAVRA